MSKLHFVENDPDSPNQRKKRLVARAQHSFNCKQVNPWNYNECNTCAILLDVRERNAVEVARVINT